MIIQALSEQYERIKDDLDEGIPLPSFSNEKVHFEFVLDKEGRLLQINDLRDEKKSAKPLVVPVAVKRSVNIEANFLCDNTAYVLGRSSAEKESVAKKSNRGNETFLEFKKLHHEIGGMIDDEGMRSVLKFIDSWVPASLEKSLCWQKWGDLADTKIVFRLDGEREYIHDKSAVKQAWLKYCDKNRSKDLAYCLVSGKKSGIARLHNSIKGVKDAQSMGADIVSCNLEAFESYGKRQSYNSPISEDAMFNYTTMLTHLLRRESRQKIQIGDATTVFWAEGKTLLTGFLKDILDPRENSPDIEGLKLFLEAIRDGKKPDLESTKNLKFYILGLSPNNKRLSIRFWYVDTVEHISKNIGQHFSDLRIRRESEDRQSEYPGIWQLLHVTALRKETKNISPILAGAMTRSILTGNNYPRTLLTAVIERIRAEQSIDYFQASLIKAYLVRNNRILKKNLREVGMSLDKEQKNIGYLLGRLFAALEKAQKDAIPGANTTIKDRFYASASSTPSVVFPQLLRLSQHHIQKSDYGWIAEKIIEEIMADIKAFPTRLNLEDQGMFALGYYHQKPEMYKKSEKKEEGN